jgi:hypothetical protein
LDGQDIKYRLRQGNSRKYATIKFLSREEMEIILPRNIEVDPQELLRKKASLIERKYRELLSRQMILDGDTLLYKGKLFQIEVLRNDGIQKKRVSTRDGKIQVSIVEGENPATVLRNWLAEKTRQYAKRIIRRNSKNPATQAIEVNIRDIRRWGYCTKSGRLVFNWQLIALPPQVAEYVVLHEYAHLFKFNHQKAFHKILANNCPEYKAREKELKKFIPIAHISLPDR